MQVSETTESETADKEGLLCESGKEGPPQHKHGGRMTKKFKFLCNSKGLTITKIKDKCQNAT